MMRSLSLIKVLRIEIETYIGASQPKAPESVMKPLVLQAQRSAISTPEEEQVQENCFSCIQEYLKGLLGFINATSSKLSGLYMTQGFLDLLYDQNIKFYTS